jgi:hypothetical protein
MSLLSRGVAKRTRCDVVTAGGELSLEEHSTGFARVGGSRVLLFVSPGDSTFGVADLSRCMVGVLLLVNECFGRLGAGFLRLLFVTVHSLF